MKVQLIIPIYNPDEKFTKLIEMLKKQWSREFFLLVIDSGSKKIEKALFDGIKHVEIQEIDSRDFDHGRTRQYGIDMNRDADIYIFLTQDAILANEYSLKSIVSAFENTRVGCAFGRQLPQDNATIFARMAREYNYKDESYIRYISDKDKYGMKTAFISNSFAAYRKEAIEDVGGFPKDTILSEDMYVAAKMLINGWGVAYCSDALVYHSHNYTILEEFKRYFDIGVFQSRESWIRRSFGNAEKNGRGFVFYELKKLWRNPWLLALMLCRDGAKYFGYRLGIVEKYFPRCIKRKISMNYRYWL